MRYLKNCILICLFSICSLHASQRFIVRTLSLGILTNTCRLLGCSVSGSLGDPAGQLVLVTTADGISPISFIAALLSIAGVVNAEQDLPVRLSQSEAAVPAALYDSVLMSYFGVDVREGYILQPAAQIIRIQEAQATFHVGGAGTVAVIDTGVDPEHPLLANILLPGYDFTRNQSGASENADVTQSTAAVVDGAPAVWVNAYTAAILDQSTAAVVDDPDHAAFGHGTMVSGIIHLVAPEALILPLKAFRADGSGYTSDILRAIYRAVQKHANVINMSFSMSNESTEFHRAVDYATSAGAVCVSSAGNSGQNVSVYPAAWDNVIGVASTANDDTRSTFSNYGQKAVWVAAPGEGVVTTYPYGAYAAAWGTSFSAPFVSGTASLLLQARGSLAYSSAAAAVANAKPLGTDLGNGRLDVVRSIQAAQSAP